MPVVSIRRKCKDRLGRLASRLRREKALIVLVSAAIVIFGLAFFVPVLATPIGLALTVITLRWKA